MGIVNRANQQSKLLGLKSTSLGITMSNLSQNEHDLDFHLLAKGFQNPSPNFFLCLSPLPSLFKLMLDSN